MKRRLLAGLAGLVLAAVGGVMLMTYVGHADERAMAGMETLNVFVVKGVIPAGTAASGLPKLVGLETLPAKAVAPNTVSSLDSLAGLVTTVDLQPGEQLLSSRFVDPAALPTPGEVEVPPGLQQVSIAMERQRMLGNALTPGATVGVFVSLAKGDELPAQTHLVLHKVLVTKVGEDPPAGTDEETPKTAEPADLVLVTFAVTARDAEQIVFGKEHGQLYLSLEPSDATTSGTRTVTPENVYQ